jgi:hypothetical protein
VQRTRRTTRWETSLRCRAPCRSPRGPARRLEA